MEKILIDNETTTLIERANDIVITQNIYTVNGVTDEQTAIRAKQYSKSLMEIAKQLDNKRLELTKPLRDNAAEINGGILPVVKRLDDASKAANMAVYAWQESERKRIEQEKRQALIEQSKKDKITETQVAPVIKTDLPKLTRTRKVWRVEIISDIKDVDPQYIILSLDDSKIDAAIKAGRIKIKGLKIYQEEEAVRG